jgi:hypothetical protein
MIRNVKIPFIIKIIKDKNSKGDNTFPNISIIEVGLNVKNRIKPK